jgi:hypothetical protein
MKIGIESKVVTANLDVNTENVKKGLSWLKRKTIEGLDAAKKKLDESTESARPADKNA